MTRGDYENFCYLVSLLSIVYSSGQAGFCICFFGTEFEDTFVFYDCWCLIESLVFLFAAILLSYGVFKEKRNLILAWFIIALVCLLAYFAIAIYVWMSVSAIMHYEFLVPIFCWKFFLVVALAVVLKHYLSMASKDAL